ncbi:MAG TPA: hypothetical protein VK606_13810, partial [Verrucomicrobiae bacterium]|nr:hypothetical protein [Verrucomicrobiae bacterium]
MAVAKPIQIVPLHDLAAAAPVSRPRLTYRGGPLLPAVLYYVFLPPGVTITLDGAASCSSFCGYHGDINGGTFYAVMPYPDCSGCLGAFPVLDALTSTSSHEL